MDKSEIKAFIAKRTAKELHDGDVVNLGIGLPDLVPNYLPEGVKVTLQAELGIVSSAPAGLYQEADPFHLVNASGKAAGIAPDGAFIDSETSFGLIRGGHVQATILGGLEVDEEGSLSNWIIPGKKMPGMGGAMDLLVGAENVIVAIDYDRFHVSEAATRIACEPAGSAVGGVLDVIIGRVEADKLVPEGYHESHN